MKLSLVEDVISIYPKIVKWYQGHALKAPPLCILETMCLCVEDETGPFAYTWVYTTSSGGVCLNAWTVTRPNTPAKKARQGVKAMIEFAKQECAERGYLILLTSTSNTALGKIFLECGFQQGDNHATQYIYQL